MSINESEKRQVDKGNTGKTKGNKQNKTDKVAVAERSI